MWLCKRDLLKECEGKYKDCTDCVLDKIRAEIIQMPTISFNANDIYKTDVLAIIDKYKSESDDNKEGLKYCDRNICVSNEYSGVGCDECAVNAKREE